MAPLNSLDYRDEWIKQFRWLGKTEDWPSRSVIFGGVDCCVVYDEEDPNCPVQLNSDGTWLDQAEVRELRDQLTAVLQAVEAEPDEPSQPSTAVQVLDPEPRTQSLVVQVIVNGQAVSELRGEIAAS